MRCGLDFSIDAGLDLFAIDHHPTRVESVGGRAGDALPGLTYLLDDVDVGRMARELGLHVALLSLRDSASGLPYLRLSFRRVELDQGFSVVDWIALSNHQIYDSPCDFWADLDAEWSLHSARGFEEADYRAGNHGRHGNNRRGLKACDVFLRLSVPTGQFFAQSLRDQQRQQCQRDYEIRPTLQYGLDLRPNVRLAAFYTAEIPPGREAQTQANGVARNGR